MCEKVKIRCYLSRKWGAGENLSVTMTVMDSLQHLAVISQFQKSHSVIQKSVFIMPYKVMCFLQPTCKAEFLTHNWHEPHCIPFQIFLPEYKLPNTSGHKTKGSAFTVKCRSNERQYNEMFRIAKLFLGPFPFPYLMCVKTFHFNEFRTFSIMN